MDGCGAFRWFARPTYSMLSGEPALYRRFSDGLILEAGHLLLRRRYLLRNFSRGIHSVDPRTPAFQTAPTSTVDPRTKRVRTSYLRLASAHGGPIWKHFSRLDPVKPKHFTSQACISMAAKVLELQSSVHTRIVLPPYFAFRSMDDGWLAVNARMYEAMAELAGGSEVYMPLAFDHGILRDPDALTEWATSFGARGYALWPIGLDEFRADAETLAGLSTVLSALPGSALMLYSGPFSVLLCALTGSSLSSGPCFYEMRNLQIAPRLEFRPRCRYQLRALYQKVDPVAAVVYYRVLEELSIDPDLCPACTRNLNGNGYEGLAAMPDLDVFEHNFRMKRQEMDMLQSSPDPIECTCTRLRTLLENRQRFSQFRSLKFASTWLKAMSSIS